MIYAPAVAYDICRRQSFISDTVGILWILVYFSDTYSKETLFSVIPSVARESRGDGAIVDFFESEMKTIASIHANS